MMCMKAALTKYHEVMYPPHTHTPTHHTHTHTHTQVNGCLPDRVVVFRDGVGDGQMATVQGFEVAQMKEAFTMFGIV